MPVRFNQILTSNSPVHVGIKVSEKVEHGLKSGARWSGRQKCEDWTRLSKRECLRFVSIWCDCVGAVQEQEIQKWSVMWGESGKEKMALFKERG